MPHNATAPPFGQPADMKRGPLESPHGASAAKWRDPKKKRAPPCREQGPTVVDALAKPFCKPALSRKKQGREAVRPKGRLRGFCSHGPGSESNLSTYSPATRPFFGNTFFVSHSRLMDRLDAKTRHLCFSENTLNTRESLAIWNKYLWLQNKTGKRCGYGRFRLSITLILIEEHGNTE